MGVCKAKLKYFGGTSSLGNHLKVKFLVTHQAHQDNSEKASTLKQILIKETFEISQSLPKHNKEQIDKAIEDYIVHGLRPLSTVDNLSFVELMKTRLQGS